MLENLRRKSLVKTYNDHTHRVHFEQGLVRYGNQVEIDVCNQRLSKELQERSFKKAIEMVSSETFSFFTMIYCPTGRFMKGGSKYNDNPYMQETIEKPFLLGEAEITQELYEKVMKDNPSEFKHPQNPVENVSWYDAILFCNKLSELQGLECCYDLTAISTIDKDRVDQKRIMSAKVTCDFNKNGYRLPLEKEWEYAAKAGTQNQWAGTNKGKELGEYAWFWDNSRGSTHPIKTKKPNPWGFYDMSGNVKDWCWNLYSPRAQDLYAVRGGSWKDDLSTYLKVAYRDFNSPDYRCNYLGFRVARSMAN